MLPWYLLTMLTQDDHNLIRSLEDCTLPEFHHADHVRVAWILLQQQPLAEVIPRFAASLKRYATHKGSPGLYHETITWAFMSAIGERLRHLGGDGETDGKANGGESSRSSWEEFRDGNPDLFQDFRGFLERYYSPERLDSDAARNQFLLPDRSAS